MKLLNEIISELTSQQEEVITPFDDGQDTFFDEKDPEQLCWECKAVGFCRLRHPEEFKAKKAIEIKRINALYRMPDEEISNIIPLKEMRVTWELFGKFRIEHLQIAHDAFHQQDYETAILHYKSILEEYYYDETAHMYVAVSYYFTGDYNRAIDHASRITNPFPKIEKFLLHCHNVNNKSNESIAEIELERKDIEELVE